MRKFYYVLATLAVIISGYFAVKFAFPKDAGRYPFFAILLLLDLYLWFSVRKRIFKQNTLIRVIITVFYWIPLITMVVLLGYSFVKPVMYWDAALRTYGFGFVVIAYASKLLTVIFLFLTDMVRLVKHIYRFSKQKKTKKPEPAKGKKISRSKFLENLAYITGGVAFSGMLIGMIKWAYEFKVRRVDVRIPAMPGTLNGLKVVQISDLHLGSWSSTAPLKEAVQIINDLNPDLVLFTGDLVNFSTREALDFEDILKEVKARYGVYTILGNHDYGDYVNWSSLEEKNDNLQQLYDFYNRIGWKLLRNENDILRVGDDEIAIIGVENWSASSRFPKLGNLDKALYGTGEVPVKLLLSHDPSHWENVVRRKYPEIDLTLSGHTHGFQFGIETPAFKWSPAQYIYKQWAGLYSNGQNDKQYIYVNRGTGFIGYPGRIGILPEITLLTLQS